MCCKMLYVFILLETVSSMIVCDERSSMSYECVICGQALESSEDQPIGLIILLQPSTGKIQY